MLGHKLTPSKVVVMTTLGAIAFSALSSKAIAAPRDFVGTWVNTNPNTRGITRMIVRSRGGNRLNIQVFGQCHPQDCDWGRTRLITYGRNVQDRDHTAALATYQKSFADTVLTLRLNARDQINLRNFTQFRDNSNRQNYFSANRFRRVRRVRPGGGLSSSIREDCVGFNPITTRVRRLNGSYKIVDGSHWMFDFGNRLGEARSSLRIIKHYGANQSCFVGRPDPSLKYLLVNNRAPTGQLSGEDCVAFDPNRARVRQVNNRWKIVDRNHLVFDFGNQRGEARQSLAIIRKHNFRKSCFVGRPGPSFTYLRR